MTRLYFLFLLSVLVFTTLEAQVTSGKRSMITGSQDALILSIKGADSKFVESAWKEYVKSYGKVMRVKGSKESVVEGIHVRDIGQGTLLNVYSLASVVPDGTEFVVWFDRGGDYLKAADKEYSTAEEFLEGFGNKVIVDMIAIDLEEQQKKLTKLESNLTKLQKENDNLHSTISNATAKIEDAEGNIPVNVSAQESARTDITNQKAVIESVKDNPEEYKIQQKLLSKLENNLTKLARENDSLHKTVSDSKAKISQAESNIVTNLEEQKSTEKAIEDQKIVVDLVQKKLDEAKSQKPN